MLLAVALAGTSIVSAADDPFRSIVAPVLARRCLSCHADDERKGGLSLQSAEALAGGDSGALVEPGDPDASLLIEMIEPTDGSAAMPEEADPLDRDSIDAIRAWIADGARWPDGFRIEKPTVADLDWWSLRPLHRPDLPEVDDAEPAELRSPIDRFLLAELRRNGLGFSPPADRRTLIRRLTYDLTGLPPTPDRIARFVDDPDPLAYEKLVDELLDSPHYGERWARHWLDVVQYGDTHGYDKDKLRENAWPYRDYVIRAFSEDKPYGRFVREQLAGDRFWPESPDGVVATGFIAAGPWDFIGHAEVDESKIDGQIARSLDRDNMVSSALNTFTSLTVQCARCHDHKFDPVTMEDYYALQAVFAAIDRADRSYDPDPSVAVRRLELTREIAAVERERNETDAAIASKMTDELRSLRQRLEELQRSTTEIDDPSSPRTEAYGWHSQVAVEPDRAKWVQVDLGRSLPIDRILLVAADEYGFGDFGFPERYRVEVSDDADFRQPRLLHDGIADDAHRPGRFAVVVDADETAARFVRVTAERLWNRRRSGEPLSNDWIFALGELTVVSNGAIAAIREVTSLDSIEAPPRWSRVALIDGIYGSRSLADRFATRSSSPTNGFHSEFATQATATKSVAIDLGETRSIDQIRLVPAKPVDWQPTTPGFGFPVRYRIELSDEAEFTSPRVAVDRSESDQPNPGDEIVEFELRDQARFVRLVAERLWDRGENRFAFALAEIEIVSAGENVAAGRPVLPSDSIDAGLWHRDALTDGYSSRAALVAPVEQLAALVAPEEDRREAESIRELLERRTAETLGPELPARRAEIDRRLDRLRAELDALPAPSQVYAGTVHAGSGAFRGRAGLGPREIRVLARGDVTRPGELASPGAVPLIPDVPARFDLADPNDESARRAALAEWIVRDDNPLTWRSIVNRIWLHHFGRGIVDSPNDFGRGGQLPSHPELLDWLAVEFRDGGQSFKRLHRMICLSSAYRQQVARNSEAERIDGGNRLLWRMNRRRLSAEEVRDSILLLAGRLDTRMGGPGFMDFVIERPEHSPHYEYQKYDPLDPATHRRSIYRFIVRSQPQPFLTTLDCADPSMSVAKRDETQTSLQALAMLNNRFVVAMADELAARAERDAPDLEGQIESLFLRAIGRLPSRDELAALAEYAREFGLANTGRMIVNLNEFVFVD